MSFATDMLAKAQAAYAKALDGKNVQKGDRAWSPHDIEKLRAEVMHWQQQVDAEISRAAGKAARKPFQVMI